jgi:regulator of protease activity HflC (stomatin/prohibitin superfamily)
MPTIAIVLFAIVVRGFLLLSSTIKIVQEYERGVIFRLGRLVGARGPGLFFLIARQAEAGREKRAKVIHADGEFSASQQLANAAQVMIGSKAATLQLRHLQRLTKIAAEENSTSVFPLQLELLLGFFNLARQSAAGSGVNGNVLRASTPV